MKGRFHYFSRAEWALWLGSLAVLTAAFLLIEGQSAFSYAASLLGVTSLIFCAKGNPFGQVLMMIFSLLYGVVSLQQRYYGEVATYVGMTLPMSVIALVEWLRHPSAQGRAQVQVRRVSRRELLWLVPLTGAVTAVFFFVLRAFGTARLLPSTLSVTTSFAAVYLTFRRDPRFALAYACNDIVLLLLWIPAAVQQLSYLPAALCFAVFLINDLYGFRCWLVREKSQTE